MVWSRDAERPPLSAILPRLYLGAEGDVTQERLASLGVSYVLSVSRCSPQPSFLPPSRYLRIPIDDSLWAELLPWIPQALHFIDAAVSSGASVLVHCAAGVSRSPAVAVAYVMYRLGLDLDHAYRHTASGGDLLVQRQPAPDDAAHYARHVDARADGVTGDSAEQTQQRESSSHAAQQRRSQPDGRGNRLTLHLTLNPVQQPACEAAAPSRRQPAEPAAAAPRPQLPAGSASLSEKRKSLTLFLTPVEIRPPSSASSSRRGGGSPAASKSVHKREPRAEPEEKRQSPAHMSPAHREQSPAHGMCGTAEVKGRGLLPPLGATLNKLLGWGERLLLGGLFAHPVRMGRPALPYEC
ncbi:Dual specificity protein phosphatase 16 [Liparis tanakae]|uniref:protein-tyrosine-phosphatase n=1 Tax=Liparis tanakae TaxID=230148 RepID=A0A4Z2IY74_9TELE|nr:Dual specificity protein phosphatase 16 [Liparis tanakae]